MSELPQGVDDTHFSELGKIEVLVMRCRMSDLDDNTSTTSSAEDSDILVSSAQTDGPAPYRPRRDYKGKAKAADAPEAQERAVNPFAAMPGSFDGPSDEHPLMDYDGPAAGLPGRGWHSHGQQPAPYEPHEAAPYPHHYHPAPGHQYHGPPPHAYHPSLPTINLPSRPPRPERHVRFDLGDGRGPQQHRRSTSSVRYDDRGRYYGPNAWREEHAYGPPGPEYREPSRHRDAHPYSDYLHPPPDLHYMYDGEQNFYSYYPEVNLSDDGYPPTGSFIDPRITHGQAFPAAQAYPQPTAIPIPRPKPVTFLVPPPSARPQHFPAQPWPAVNQQPMQYPVPVWAPSPAGTLHAPVPPGAVPVYPPPNNLPLFHTHAPNPAVALFVPPATIAASSEPGPAVSEANTSTAQKSAAQEKPDTDDASQDGNKAASNAENKEAQDPLPKEGTGNAVSNDGWGDNIATNINDITDTANAHQSWTFPSDTNQSGNDPTGDTSNSNHNNDSWNNNDATNNDSSWQQNDQSNDTWGNDDQNAKKSDGGWGQDNDPKDNSASSGAQAKKRILYGPHGPYYTTEAAASTAPTPDAEEEPRYDVPRAIAEQIGASRQVQPGRGYIYQKKRYAPEYIDTLEEPYARIVFKYRTKEQIKKEIGVELGQEPTANEDANTLENMDKSELIKMVLRAKGALGGKIPSPPAKAAKPAMSQFHEQIPVTAPDVGFLSYKLPPGRKASDKPGLGIDFGSSSSNKKIAGAEKEQQNSRWDGGAANWPEEGSTQQKNSSQGWDGQQESEDSGSSKNITLTWSGTGKDGSSEVQDQSDPAGDSNALKKVGFGKPGVVQPATPRLSQEAFGVGTPANMRVPGSSAFPSTHASSSMAADEPGPSHSWMQGNLSMAPKPSPGFASLAAPTSAWTSVDPSMAVNAFFEGRRRDPAMKTKLSVPQNTPVQPQYWARPDPPLPAHHHQSMAAPPNYAWEQANPSVQAHPSMPFNDSAQPHAAGPSPAGVPPHPVYSPGTARLVANDPNYEELFLKNPLPFDPGPPPPIPPRNPARLNQGLPFEPPSSWSPVGTGWSSGLPYEGD